MKNIFSIRKISFCIANKESFLRAWLTALSSKGAAHATFTFLKLAF